MFPTLSISGCCSKSCTMSAWPPLAAKWRGELSWPLSKFGLQLPFSSNSFVASTLPCLRETKRKLHHNSSLRGQNRNGEHRGGWASNSPAGVVDGGPVVTVHLRNWEAAVQELREQLSVPFTGTAVKGEVVHPLPIPKKITKTKKTIILKMVPQKCNTATGYKTQKN